MGAAIIGGLAVDVPAVGLPGAGVLIVVSGPIYYISRPVFDFPLVKIVFLIVKLITQGQQVQVS